MNKTKIFWLGAVTSLGVCASLGAIVAVSGVLDVSALNAGGPQDALLGFASSRSIAHHAKPGDNPLAHDEAALHRGLEQYRESCAPCHGGPGTEAGEWSGGLHPSPPDLSSPSVQGFTDGMLYQAISGGVGSTGMPGFGHSLRQEEIWGLVAAVRHLRSLTAEEKALLTGRAAAASAPTGNSEPPSSSGTVHKLSITGFKFALPTLEIAVGDQVEWKNDDFVAHTATSDDHTTFDTGRLDSGQSKRITFKTRGTFPYSCKYHSGMKGTVVVK